ncbi:MAG: multidrug efflux RND transporter permease subunit, partial [Clostridium sp.]|nr:multidrug efflux RND transporter permease subunit [Clostridium sp.]
MKSDFFIDRPVFSIVMSIVILVIGGIGLVMLPVDQYPQIVPPVVKIAASYPGADAMTVTQAVATPIEQQLNGSPGMVYMESTSTNNGGFSALVTYDISTDPDLAAVDIQNRLKKAESSLPAEVVKNGISVEKQASGKLMTITLLSDDPKFDEIYLSNYATLNVVDMIRRVPGVSHVSNVGSRYYAMQIWVQPDKLANLGLTVQDIQSALQDQNRESAAGVLGQAPVEGVDVTIPITARGRLSSVSEFEEIVVKAFPDGSIIRLKDLARISLEASSYSTESGINGGNAAVLEVTMLPGANALEVAGSIKEQMKEISKNFPEGISYNIPFDMTEYISESIHHVYRSLFEAMILVIIVVYLSLQSWRATLIPVIAVPISLIGTFGVMLIFGFSLNMLTLLGLILAIGIVVDDAIVVVENVDRLINAEGLSPYDATKKAMASLGGALVAMSLVLCAVFVPVSFLSGISGQLYRQFSVTIAVSVIISTIVALTLSPVMCVLLMRPDDGKPKNRLFRAINRWLEKGNSAYSRAVSSTFRHSRRMIVAFGVILAGIWLMHRVVPQSFMPHEDQGYFTVELELPEGATIERTRQVTDRAIEYLMEHPDVEYVLNVTGSSPRMGTSSARSQMTVILKPAGKRRTSDISGVMAQVRSHFEAYPESKVYLSTPPVIPGLGNSGGFEMVLEARGNTSYDELREAVDSVLAIASRSNEFGSLTSSMQPDIPQLYFDVDRDRAKFAGVPVSDIFSTMKAYTGSVYVNDFNMYNRIYRVYLQAESPYRSTRDNLNMFYVRGNGGVMIPIMALGDTRFTTGPGTMKRFNMFQSATISGEAAHGYSSGQAMAKLESIVRDNLPPTIGVEWSGLAYQEKHEGGKTGIVLALAFAFVFLFLAALYESWLVPVAVLLSLPVAGLGAYLGIWICGLENNIYYQIGLVMLIGLVAKNAILIVEFAKDGVDRGASPLMAAKQAAKLRFRPIIMTSLAFILGLIPLVMASGPGSESRRGIGTGVFFGMIVAIIFGIIFVPFFFVWIYKLKSMAKSYHIKRHAKAVAFGAIAIAASLSSCSGTKNLRNVQVDLPPESYFSQADSASIADMRWWEFYGDSVLCEMIRCTLSNNKSLLIQGARAAELEHYYQVDRAALLPQLSAGVYGQDEHTDYSGNSPSHDYEYGLKATISWEADIWGRLSNAKRQGYATFLSAVELYRARQISLIAEVASTYYRLVALDGELGIVRSTLKTREEALKMAKLRFEGGLTSETVYRQAEVEYASAAALIPDLENRISQAENTMAFLMGQYPDSLMMRYDSDVAPKMGKLSGGLSSELLMRRPDVRADEQKLRAAMA